MLENGTYREHREVNWYADKSLTFVRISDLFGFSSSAYFSHYVQQHLGVSPTEYRG
ncbi:MAG TPA: AraC family transcriptional regulator [Candidatus Bacteroides avicola]|uniref:AraC family transcriptional regulator n=1 Tax=Candidatus Bacteroides avicola TaxID=2838468 RepID=A0A9D2HXV3_9BACE|nr:AraC family transcriptional regulator [Candidatus Bacteroides avicola]